MANTNHPHQPHQPQRALPCEAASRDCGKADRARAWCRRNFNAVCMLVMVLTAAGIDAAVKAVTSEPTAAYTTWCEGSEPFYGDDC